MKGVGVRVFAVAAVLSLIACLTTVGLWVATGKGSRRVVLWEGRTAVYAGREGMMVRVAGARGARSWEVGYLELVVLTGVLPGAWGWWRWRPRGVARLSTEPTEADVLRERIRFLLPGAVAIYLIIGMIVMALDTGQPALWGMVVVMGAGVVLNMMERRRLKTELRWLTSGACRGCGYDLEGNTSGVCPECGRRVV